MLLQLDGSPHDWLEGRGPRLTLLVAIDDATNEVPNGCFGKRKMTRATSSCCGGSVNPTACRRRCTPTGTLQAALEQALAGERPRSQFGRVMDALGVEMDSRRAGGTE